MASLAFTFLETFLLEMKLCVDQRNYDFLEERVTLSLEILKYLSKRFNNDQRLKLAEENIRVTACEAEYSFEECKQDRSLLINIMRSKAGEIFSLSTDLLNSFVSKAFNYEQKFSYVVSPSAFDIHEVPHSSDYRSSYDQKLIDFVVENSKSDLDLRGVIIGGSVSGTDNTTVARYIYTDIRIKCWFPIRAWVTLSRDDQNKDVMQRLLRSILQENIIGYQRFLTYLRKKGRPWYWTDLYRMSYDEHFDCLSGMSYDELFYCLYQLLKYHKSFIVIDNSEDSLAFHKFSFLFENKKNGSRVLFTPNIDMPTSILPDSLLVLGWTQILKMFYNLAFGERSCPKELEIIALNILNSCKGSPTAVFMVAKYLSTIDLTPHSWLVVQASIKNDVSVFKDLIPGISSALLKASEPVMSIHPKETNIYVGKCETKTKQPERSEHLQTSPESTEAKNHEQVGLGDCLEQLLQSSSKLEKLAIAGMAGIGKTTLAKMIFDHFSVTSHFHIRAWVDVSQFYQKRSLLIQLLQGITKLTDNEILNETDFQLQEKLKKNLSGRRYLIIMDDMWSIEAWNELQRTFPDNNMGSRILLTSRESNLIEGLNCKIVHRMSLLTKEKSWDLLKQKVFGQDICPPDLAVIGKQIAKRCQGLPLSIVVVAGLLKINKTMDSWNVVAESVSSHVMSSETTTRTIFSLSYEHLPDYLKSCFLYIGVFPGGYNIEVQRLIRLWIAEGFISNAHEKCLEDVAEEYLNDLIDRSLLLSGRRRSNGRLKTCRPHDLVLEFCIQEARKEKFLDVIKDFTLLDSKSRIDGHHRFSFHCHTFDDAHLAASKSLAGSALFFRVPSRLVPDILIHYLDFKLLRVLDLISWRFDNFPTEQIAKLLLLRYLALTAYFELPGILFNLQKLQTLVINGPWLNTHKTPQLPSEFWRATSLRHLQLRMVNHLLSPEKLTEAKYLNFLQTLTDITLASCTHEIFSSVPNIIKLGVCETHEDFLVDGLWDRFFQNLVLLKSIQTLKISCFGHSRPLPLPSLDAFPNSLKKMTLRQTNLPWESMELIGDLPNLEVLKLKSNAFRGPEWETREGGFQKLKYLLIEKTNLVHWELEGHHFPRLERLVLKFCEVLEEVPIEIGDIPTLTHIKLENCCSSVERSAKDIQEQCTEYGQEIKIQIRSKQAS